MIMELSRVVAAAHSDEDWTKVDRALTDVFESVHPPHFYVAALHVTLSERDNMTTWYSFRDFLLENSTSDIKTLMVGL